MLDVDMIEFWPALEAAIENVEKYYNKSDNSPVNIVSLCMFSSLNVFIILMEIIISDLNPCIKDKYIKAAWDIQGQSDAWKTMEKIVSFNEIFIG